MISQTAFGFAADLVPTDTITAHGETLYVSQWAQRIGLSEDTLRKRLANGWAHELAVSAPKQVTNRPIALRKLVQAGDPGSSSWYDLDYREDEHAQAFVAAHPDGASMEEVGAAMGVEVSWICEMEQKAFAKLREKIERAANCDFDAITGQTVLMLVGASMRPEVSRVIDADMGARELFEDPDVCRMFVSWLIEDERADAIEAEGEELANE